MGDLTGPVTLLPYESQAHKDHEEATSQSSRDEGRHANVSGHAIQ